MSPHGLIFLMAVLSGVGGELLFPRSTLLVVGASSLALLAGLLLYIGEPPSPLGLALVTPMILAGAAIGVAAGRSLSRLRGRS